MEIHTLKTGMRVRWAESAAYAVDGQRVARRWTRAGEPADVVVEGTRGTVVCDGDRVVVVIDEYQRDSGPIDEVEWLGDGSSTASRLAIEIEAVEVTGMIDSCPECGNASLFGSDRKRGEWTIFCVNPTRECGATVLVADLSEEARIERRSEIDRDEPVLAEIREALAVFAAIDDEAAEDAAREVLEIVNKHRAKGVRS